MTISIKQIKMENALIHKTIELETSADSINTVTKYIDSIYEVCEDEMRDSYGNVIIAVTEAVNNAINHGNKNDTSKKITVSYKKENKLLTFTVGDEGEGFDFTDIPDPTDPENLEKLNGRGIFLMKNLVDDINFHEGGKKVELIFHLA